MQHFMKKAAALALAMVMALSLASVAFAADFPDMPDDWSTAALEAAVENGLISGKDGKIAASDNLTRAEMATIITRAFGAEVEDDISFADVKNDAWYKSAVAKAVHMGAMGGVGSNNFAGAASITRQEVFVVLARVLKLADGDAADLAAFSDADKTATWAVPAVAALVKSGYVSGSNGALNPTANITRAEFSQVMYNIFHNAYLTKAGTYEEVDGDNVIISSTNVTVKGVDVKGDVVIADGVGDGDVFFEDVTIGGRLVVRGGGMNSVHFKDSKVGTVIMSKVDGNVRLVVTGESTVETVAVEAGKASTDVRVEGTVGAVVVNDNASTVVLADATVAKVEVNKANTTVSLAGKTVVAEMTVAAGATGTNINAEPNTEITKLDTAEELTINNEDAIKDCNDDEKVNPERPEESADPSASASPSAPAEDTGSTTAHTHTFKIKGGSGADKNDVVWVAVDAKQHSTVCAQPETDLDPAPETTPTYCGATIYRSHNFETVKADGQPDKLVCKDCGFVSKVADQITATGADCGNHEWKTEPEAGGTKATCNDDGVVTYKCKHMVKTTGEDGTTTEVACTGTKTVTTPATGHSYDRANGEVTTEPTCITPGVKTLTCTNDGCAEGTEGHTMEEGIPATGKHVAKTDANSGALVWTTTDPDKHWVACAGDQSCEYHFREGAHTFRYEKIVTSEENADPVTYDANNHKATCTVCGKETTETHDNKGAGGACSKCGYKAEGGSGSGDTHTGTKTAYEVGTDANAGKHRLICTCDDGANCTVNAVTDDDWTPCTYEKAPATGNPTGECVDCGGACPHTGETAGSPCSKCGVTVPDTTP
mgnify:FL=1